MFGIGATNALLTLPPEPPFPHRFGVCNWCFFYLCVYMQSTQQYDNRLRTCGVVTPMVIFFKTSITKATLIAFPVAQSVAFLPWNQRVQG